MEQHLKLSATNGTPLENPSTYRRLIGRLIYLTITRPDITYSVHNLSQFMHTPLQPYYNAALRLLRYLKGTPGKGILLPSTGSLHLTGYCDSDWASCPMTRRSTSGYITMLGSCPISWKTKKQVTVARSSCEVEYRSMALLCCELVWLKTLLQDLHISHSEPITLHCDNKAALHIATNPVFHERTKHIELDCHFVRDKITDGLIKPSYMPTDNQLADLFTKALGKDRLLLLLGKLGMYDIHAPT
ncbi:uncharacterized protein LOC109834628 [Asparagus officinalis]|uniref:uncharacterized protein LOC109834628 n=1 Tax=Asparagus officinalis TaxID=4686 RepID=UPI00098E85D8|nr:uncharacterized protein LOC109834628 [Asparagus officinalis]